MVPTPATMSPTIAAFVASSTSVTWPRACPGVCSTRQRMGRGPSSASTSPSFSVRATGTSRRSAVRSWAHTGTPRPSHTRLAPPTWSPWWWVSTTATGR